MKRYAGIGALKLSRYLLLENPSPEILERFRRIIRTDLSIPRIERLIREETAELKKEDGAGRSRLFRIARFCASNPAACTLMELAFLEYMDPVTDEALGFLFPGHGRGVRLLEAAQLTWPQEEYADHLPELLDAAARLERFLLKDHESLDPLFRHYRADTALMAFLEGEDALPELLSGCVKRKESSLLLEPEILYGKEKEEIVKFIKKAEEEKKPFPIVQLRGAALMGKRFLARHCASACGSDLLLVDFAGFTRGTEEEFQLKREALLREVFLYEAMICIYQVSEKEPLLYDRCWETLALWEEGQKAVFLTTEENGNRVFGLKHPILEVELRAGSYADNLRMWESFSSLYLPKKEWDAAELAGRLPLPAGMIKKVLEIVAFSPEKYTDIQSVFRLCHRLLETEPEPSLKRVSTSYTMDQLKVDKRAKRVLQNICSQIEDRMQVYDTWEMRRLYPYGRCVSVLFTGPPGTGKTMAASVIANTVRLELYRVDLSQIIDKYIGETEKRLENIFEQAEKSHCILFFDEADAIFGKRSELNDSKDRFANTQVSYLLQRIEAFDGIVILASNYRKNIDEAFTRRISYIIDFVNPDAATRKEIWESLFLESMEYEDIDFDFLASNFELTGAMIKNIVLKAAFFAVAKEQPLGMEHILAAMAQEYSKSGRSLKREELGEYGYLITELL